MNLRHLTPLLAAALLACGSASPAEPATARADRTQPQPDPAATVLASGTGELDTARGTERLQLLSDGTVRAGALSGQVPMTGVPSRYWADQQARVSVVPLDGSTRALLVAVPGTDNEDPANTYHLVLQRGDRLVTVFSRTIGVYGPVPPEFPGDGTLVVAEDAYEACNRVTDGASTDSASTATRKRYSYRLSGDAMTLVDTLDTGLVADCTQLPACPFVYVVKPGGERVFAGEILRWIRGAEATTTQGLRLGEADAERVVIHLAEEKPETTYLDAIVLKVDGVAYAPEVCEASTRPDFCDVDGKPFVLREGEQLELTFDVPAGRRELVATGYYVPTGWRTSDPAATSTTSATAPANGSF